MTQTAAATTPAPASHQTEKSRAYATTPSATARPNGSQLSSGIRITAAGSASSGEVAKVSRPSASTGPVLIIERCEPSPRRSSQSGWRLPIVGRTAKLYGGGGDGMLH